MEQRPLRVGDLVDDYCPRERRLTNHTIVAIVDDSIRQTRCTTCDADHPYKAARAPRPRKKDAVDIPAPVALQPRAEMAETIDPVEQVAAPATNGSGIEHPPVPVHGDQRDDAWPAHRPLIRATLPRTENDPPTPRPIPEFTMHQRNVRGHQNFRQQGQGWQERGSGDGRNGARPPRFGGQGQGQGQGQGPGQGGGRSHGDGRPGGGGPRGRHRGKSERPR